MKLAIADTIVEEFVYLMEMARDAQFAIGDRLIEVVADHGGRRAEVIKSLSGQLGVTPSVLYDYYRIAERWKPAYREMYQSLDWTIYRNSDPEDPDDRELLDQAIDEGWTATRFKEEKYPAMKDVKAVIGKIRALITRNWSRFSPAARVELQMILNRLEEIDHNSV